MNPDFAVKVLRAHITEGAVFYFQDEGLSSAEPHFFVVLNKNPKEDLILVLVNFRSNIELVQKIRKADTYVIVEPSAYSTLKHRSVIDCNRPVERSVEELAIKAGLKIHGKINESILSQLRYALLSSDLVKPKLKKLCI